MIAALCFVVGVVILDELGRVLRQRIDHTSGQGICTVFVVHRALGAHGFFLLKAGITGILTVKISVGVHTGHIVHGHSRCRFDAGVHSGGIDSHAAPATDTDDTDFLWVNIFLHRKKIHRRGEVLRVDVRGSHIPGTAAAFTGKGGVEGDGQKVPLRHGLCVQPGGLLLDGPKGSAHRNSRELSLCIFRNIHIRREGDAVAVMEGNLAVVHFFAFGKCLVPFLCQNQLLHN